MKTLYQLSDGVVHVYSSGLCYASVCAPADMPAEEVERRVRALDDAGTEMGWRISEAPRFSGGQSNPCPCEKETGRVHRLFAC